MTTRIRVDDLAPELIGLDNAGFADLVESLKRSLARSNPVAVLTRPAVGGVIERLDMAPDCNEQLVQLLEHDPAGAARIVLRRLMEEMYAVRGQITYCLIPNGSNRGSGNCFGDDRLLVTVPCQGDVVS